MIRIDCRDVAVADIQDSIQISDAYHCFVKNGYALLDHVIAPATVNALREEFEALQGPYLKDMEADDSIEVGKRRFMIPLKLAGGFGRPEIFANPWIMALLGRVLDDDFVLEAFGAVLSLSGSEDQHIHADAPQLFNTEISTILPAHAVTFALPLIEMNDRHGTTALWPGSHRVAHMSKDATPVRPVVPVGSCLIWDFRLRHSGTANRSELHRPMVYATYARRWYLDPVNFYKRGQRRLVFDDEFVSAAPDHIRRMFRPRI